MDKDFEKKLNLCLAKLNKEIDLDWIEIVEELGLDCSADHLRKTAYGMKETFEYFNNKTREQLYEEEYEKLLKKELEIKREKVKLQDLRTCLNKQIRENARKDNLVEILEEKLETIEPCILNDYKERSTSGKDGIMLLSDIHYGVQTYNAIDYYDTNICKEKNGLFN